MPVLFQNYPESLLNGLIINSEPILDDPSIVQNRAPNQGYLLRPQQNTMRRQGAYRVYEQAIAGEVFTHPVVQNTRDWTVFAEFQRVNQNGMVWTWWFNGSVFLRMSATFTVTKRVVCEFNYPGNSRTLEAEYTSGAGDDGQAVVGRHGDQLFCYTKIDSDFASIPIDADWQGAEPFEFYEGGRPGVFSVGKVGTVAVWNRALSEAERASLVEEPLGNPLLQERAFWFPVSVGPPERDLTGDLVQTPQEIGGTFTVTPAPITHTLDGTLVQTAQEIAGTFSVSVPGAVSLSGDLIQSAQEMSGQFELLAQHDLDGSLIQSAQEISGTFVVLIPGQRTFAGDLIQSEQQITGVFARVAAIRNLDGDLTQTPQVIFGRFTGEGFVQPVTDMVYTLSDAHVYTNN